MTALSLNHYHYCCLALVESWVLRVPIRLLLVVID